jgi:lysophospholipase L1-like esterase
MVTRVKAFQQNLLLFAGSVVVAAIFIEVVLRMVLPSPIVWKYPQEHYQYDAEIGHWLEPDQQAYTHDKAVSTNSIGLRDSEYPFEKSSEKHRILALGDSQTFGNGLEVRDTWPEQLEAYLNHAGKSRKAEVLNGGLPGSDTWQHEIILKRMLETYHPDTVVLAFYVNDVVKRFTPKPVSDKDDAEFSKRIAYVLKQSAFLLALRTVWGSVMQWWSPGEGFLEQQALLRGDDSPVLKERWNQAENSLAAMKKASDEYNASFGIVLLPRRDQIDGRFPWDAYSNHLKKIAQRYKIPVLSMLAPLQQAYKTHGKNLFIPWDGHNSKLANQVIAQEIADRMLVDGQIINISAEK